MWVISEEDARALVSVENAIAEVEKSFAAMARGEARNYPVVREVVGYQDAVFGVKTGCDTRAPILGLKAGGYWPHNLALGLTNTSLLLCCSIRKPAAPRPWSAPIT